MLIIPSFCDLWLLSKFYVEELFGFFSTDLEIFRILSSARNLAS